MTKKDLNYQELRSELDEIVLSLQQEGGDNIDETIKLYERGIQIVKKLEDYLKTAENKIKTLSAQSK